MGRRVRRVVVDGRGRDPLGDDDQLRVGGVRALGGLEPQPLARHLERAADVADVPADLRDPVGVADGLRV